MKKKEESLSGWNLYDDEDSINSQQLGKEKDNDMDELLLNFVNQYLVQNIPLVYLFFFLSSFTQIVFPPHPGDVILIFQGYLTTVNSSFHFLSLWVLAMIATFLGSMLIYEASYRKGQRVFDYKLFRKFIPHKHVEKAKKIFHQYGHFAVFASKFVPGVNTVIIVFAGVFKVKRLEVYLSITFSIILHHCALLILGRFLGSNMKNIQAILSTYNGIVFALVIIIIVTVIVMRKRRKEEA